MSEFERFLAGTWTSWTDVGDCSVTCGSGTVEQMRECEGLGDCEGDDAREIPCELDPCPTNWGDWGDWTKFAPSLATEECSLELG